ncbi:MAG TPA: TatD family hydrolase [Thermoplasmata archaeon]|nr:TatD family hydrolase [Thermoplasmata archaeon]
MTLPDDLPIVDHHCHLSPTGEGVAAARRFREAGGTHLFLATQNYAPRVPTTEAEYVAQFETTERLARRVHEETGTVVYPVIAPYPIDLVHAAPDLGVAGALQLQLRALDRAGAWIRDRRAVALGEVGRAHFPVPEPVAAALATVFEYALAIARDAGCPAVVHSEELDRAGYRQLAELARRIGLAPERVVKHYARSRVPAEERDGIAPSYVARRELVREVARDPAPWFLETDFLDDPKRPGAVLDLTTVPRRARAAGERSAPERDALRVPFVESVERVYGLRPIVERGVPA